MRNAEVIRQWSILRDLEASRRATIDDLAQRTGVSTRTIRRDLEALQSAGFPLFDEVHDGKKYWTLEQKAFRRLDDTGFTLAELTAIYFSRSLVECLAATPFQRDVGSAFDKLAAALTPGMRQFLDRLPLVIQAKADPGTQSLMDGPSTPATASRQSASSGSPSASRFQSAAARSGQRARITSIASSPRAMFQLAITFVKALSSTSSWYSSGPITCRKCRLPSGSSTARDAQKRAVSNRISAPASRKNASSPVARQYCHTA